MAKVTSPIAPTSVCVVIPALNEEASVADVVREVRSAVPGVGVVVVDDGSTDATAQVAGAAGAQVVQLPFRLGVGGAMRAGFKYAVRHGYDAVVQVDADGQHIASYVPELVAGLADADLVIGARFAGEGRYRTPVLRRLVMKVFAAQMSRLAQSQLTDTSSGFRATGPRALALYCQHYPADYLGDTVESLALALKSGLVVRQQPVKMRYRMSGQASHNVLASGLSVLRTTLAIVVAGARPVPSGVRLGQVGRVGRSAEVEGGSGASD